MLSDLNVWLYNILSDYKIRVYVRVYKMSSDSSRFQDIHFTFSDNFQGIFWQLNTQ